MKIGTTGTRSGMTKQQQDNFRLFLLLNGKLVTELHHGSCKGADVEVHELAASVPERIVWPSDNDATRVDVTPEEGVIIHEQHPPLKRNEFIVDSTDKLIAFPLNEYESASGTWACIHHARKQNKPILIFWPSGDYTVEGEF